MLPIAPRGSSRIQRRARRWWLLPLWLLYVLLLAEASLRLAAIGFASERSSLGARSDARVIYCIGDSFTYGLRVGKDQTYPAVLQRLLDESAGATRLEVKNLGYPGLSSSNAVYAVARAIEAGDAALLLVLTGWNVNDADFQRHAELKGRAVRWTERLDGLGDRSRLYRLLKHLTTYRQRTAVLGEIEIAPQAETMHLYNFREYQEIAEQNLRTIAGLGREFDVPLVFLNYPHRDLPPNPFSRNEYYHVVFGRSEVAPVDYIVPDRREGEIAIHAVIRHVAREEAVPVVDLHDAFVRSGRTDLFQDDWHHPTAAGHELIARAVFDAIRE